MKKNILIYDDDEEILLLCKAILTKNDFVVETLSTCENVLNDIQAFKPDVILMDLWIPVMGGEKAIEIIKNNEATKNIPVLIFSANADIKQIFKKVNAEGYIEKPFSISKFIETIKRHTAWNNFGDWPPEVARTHNKSIAASSLNATAIAWLTKDYTPQYNINISHLHKKALTLFERCTPA